MIESQSLNNFKFDLVRNKQNLFENLELLYLGGHVYDPSVMNQDLIISLMDTNPREIHFGLEGKNGKSLNIFIQSYRAVNPTPIHFSFREENRQRVIDSGLVPFDKTQTFSCNVTDATNFISKFFAIE
jgi:hypothetical protein